MSDGSDILPVPYCIDTRDEDRGSVTMVFSSEEDRKRFVRMTCSGPTFERTPETPRRTSAVRALLAMNFRWDGRSWHAPITDTVQSAQRGEVANG
jgi:hypothetical protein